MLLRAFVALALLIGSPTATFASEEAKEGEAAKPIFVDPLPVTVSVISQGAVRGQLVVDYVYGVADDAAKAKVEAKMPNLRDASLRSISGYATSRVDPRRPVDTEMVAWLLQQAADQVLGPRIARVYLKVANIRKY